MSREPIPTTRFDSSRHVIQCREAHDGREVFVTLESLEAAERKDSPGPSLDAISAELGSIVAGILSQAPEPIDYMVPLSALTKLVADLEAKLAASEERVAAHERFIVMLRDGGGLGPS